MERLTKQLNLRVVYVLENQPGGCRVKTGFITEELPARHLPVAAHLHEYDLYEPTIMTQLVEKALRGQGVPLHRIHSELFNLA